MPKSVSALTSTFQENVHNSSVQDRVDQFVATLRHAIAQSELKWHAPTLSLNEIEGSIEISWWRANKSLIVSVEPDSPISYLKVWGPNIHSEMEEGHDTSAAHLIELWQWLYA